MCRLAYPPAECDMIVRFDDLRRLFALPICCFPFYPLYELLCLMSVFCISHHIMSCPCLCLMSHVFTHRFHLGLVSFLVTAFVLEERDYTHMFFFFFGHN